MSFNVIIRKVLSVPARKWHFISLSPFPQKWITRSYTQLILNLYRSYTELILNLLLISFVSTPNIIAAYFVSTPYLLLLYFGSCPFHLISSILFLVPCILFLQSSSVIIRA